MWLFDLSYTNGYAFKGRQLYVFFSLLKIRLFEKERLCSSFQKGLSANRKGLKQTGSLPCKNVSLVKMAENVPSVSGSLNWTLWGNDIQYFLYYLQNSKNCIQHITPYLQLHSTISHCFSEYTKLPISSPLQPCNGHSLR